LPPSCTICGAAWVLMNANVGCAASPGIHPIFTALQQRGLHLLLSASGTLWICSRSFQHLRENL
jgi:hypothetical protein